MRMERILSTSRSRAGRWAHLALLAAAVLILPMARAETAKDAAAIRPISAPVSPPSPSLVMAIDPFSSDGPHPLVAPAPSPFVLPALASAPASAPAFVNPVPDARVTSSFGERWNPVRARRDHHNGVDLAAAEGTPVLSPEAGVVRLATTRYEDGADWGTVVIVDHADGYQSFYAHLGSFSVFPGQPVKKGTELGTVGATGRVTGPHLHFELHKDGVPVDPKGLLEGC